MVVADRSGMSPRKRLASAADKLPAACAIAAVPTAIDRRPLAAEQVFSAASLVPNPDPGNRIERAKQEWEATADSLPQVICIVGSDGSILRANRAVERWQLADVTQVRGMTVDELLHGRCADEGCYLKVFMVNAAEAMNRGRRIRSRVEDTILGRPLEISILPGLASRAPTAQAHAGVAIFVAEDVSAIQQAESALRHSESELRLLSAQLLTAQEMERKRIACELHDSVGASLTAIKLMLEQTRASMAGAATAEGIDTLQFLAQKIGETVGEVRRISMDLRPATLDDLGLIPTLSWFFREFARIHPMIRVAKDVDVAESDIPPALRITIFRIVQEAVNNAVKHAHTDHILFRLKRSGREIQLVVEDRGCGFDPAAVLISGTSGSRGVGLSGMRERVDLSGGTFCLQTKAGAGTRIRAAWPVCASKAG